MRKLYLIAALTFLSFAPKKLFDNTPQGLPFSQNWTNTTLITTTDDWSGVNGIQGFRGDNLTGGTATDPQTILIEGTPIINVIVNQINPNTVTAGGVAEFDGIANPTIALQGSGTADAPNIVIYLNTLGQQNITIFYNVRDIDGSTDNAIQPVALQYRIGSTGNFTNVPTGFVADATTGPSLATLVTPVNAVLPSDANNVAEVQVRIITSNAVANDEWVGIDDISITGTPIGGNSNESDITLNGSFIEPSNVNYLLYQAADITDANSLEVAQFTIQDGGGAADGDALPTTLNSISFSLSNSANIRRVALYDGTTELGEQAGSATVTFNGLTLAAPDDGSKTFSVRVTFQSAVTDNQQYQFAVTSVTADVAGSGFAAANAGGAGSSIAGDDNRIEVVADRLAYAQNTTTPTALNAAMTPAVTVSANDVNANRDLDFVEQVRITSTGTLTGTPVDVAAAAGLATFSNLIHTATGTGFTLNAERTTAGDWDIVSDPFDISSSSTASDYFRSAQTGDWDDLATWESSSDNSTWIASTLIPTSAANIIEIRTGHVVTVDAAASADQVAIRVGGQLTVTTGTFTVNDGTGDDIIVENGGVYEIATSGSNPVYSGSSVVNINTLGILRISRTGYTAAGAGMNSSNYVYQTGAIAEYTLTNTFAASGVTFFPNAGPLTFPVFRITNNISGNIGGSNPTVINGVFEANGNIIFTGTGAKTFRNGILGTGNISFFSTTSPFVINGVGAILGGSGSLTVPAPALTIGPATQMIVATDKTITGNVVLGLGASVELGASNLTITGTLTGGSSLGYVKTNGTGSLHLQNIGAGPVSFPIGNSTYNPISIANGSGANWSARVEDAVNDVQPPFNTDKAINRTWHIVPTGVLGMTPDVTFNFDDNDDSQLANPAAYSGDPIRDVQFFHYEQGNWSAVSGAISLTPAEGPQSIVLWDYYFYGPVAISKISGPLPVLFTDIRAYTYGSGIQVEWTNLTESDVVHYSVERSANGTSFTSIGVAAPTRNDGGEASYAWLDPSPLPGVNFYRIQSLEVDGKRLNSVIVRVDQKGGILTLYPNPVKDVLVLQAELPRGEYQVRILNAMAQEVCQQVLNHNGGMRTETIDVSKLTSGVYYLKVGERVIRFVK